MRHHHDPSHLCNLFGCACPNMVPARGEGRGGCSLPLGVVGSRVTLTGNGPCTVRVRALTCGANGGAIMNIRRRQVTGASREGGRGLWRSGVVGSVPVVTALVFALALARPIQAVVLTCPSGDVACLIQAINTANENGQENTIELEAGIYSLTAINNMTDGPNGLPSITSTLTITGAELEGVVRAAENELPPLPIGITTVIERNALGSPPPFRLFHVAAGGVLTLEVLTLRGGDGSLGGGLLNLGTLTIRDSTLVGNRAQVAGALFNNGTFTMTNSTL